MSTHAVRVSAGPVERALDLLFPPVCVGCRRVGSWICDRCWEQAQWIPFRTCRRCGLPSATADCVGCTGRSSSCDSLSAVAQFEGITREAVHALKYEERHAISGLMGRIMAQAVGDVRPAVIVPVALHPRRRQERGYDQALLLARSISSSMGQPVRKHGVRRIRYTAQQVTLDAPDRHANVAGAFRSPHHWKGETILLVDDVSTTGATLDSAARALKDAGAGTVIGLVFALAR